MESDRTRIGHTYPEGALTLSAAQAHAFAAATDDPLAAALAPAAAATAPLAPPMAVVVGTIRLGVAQVVADSGLIGDPMRLLRLVHGEEDITWEAPLRPGQSWRVRTTLADIQQRSAGEALVLHTAVRGADGAPLARATTLLLIRAPRPQGLRRDEVPRQQALAPQWEQPWQVAADQAARYAAASGDFNPIHLDPAVAQAAGLRGCILHGLCTMAFVARAVVQHGAAGEARRLRRLRLRFTRPVFMGDRLTCLGGPLGPADAAPPGVTAPGPGVPLLVLNGDGQQVASDGWAELSD